MLARRPHSLLIFIWKLNQFGKTELKIQLFVGHLSKALNQISKYKCLFGDFVLFCFLAFPWSIFSSF